ncbi:hypothetical protein RHGRI_020563 [Rhododendron griersonianum]|uniref:Pentatricopeptide repeat-containing protein n=1 Tax=Rhododendron griersonianum TaxID=479676 RepID=A0AAV6JGY8_9ERIC|nr:hypothetical protein RHGRI_020563 [Rhododendron griersonianum]
MFVFQRMKEFSGCEPGIRSYNCLFNAFVVGNQWDRAELFFKHQEKMGVSPNLETYNVLVKISCKKLRFSEARELLEWMWGLKPERFLGCVEEYFTHPLYANSFGRFKVLTIESILDLAPLSSVGDRAFLI